MAEQHAEKSAPKPGRGMLRAAGALFLVFFANLIVGKCNIAFQWKLPHWDGVPEFLLLGAATTMLIAAALKREEAESKNEKLNREGGEK
jgi:hypothetical protein